MSKGLLTLNLASAVQEARAHVNEMEAIHGPDSILTQQAAVDLRRAQDAAREFMLADD